HAAPDPDADPAGEVVGLIQAALADAGAFGPLYERLRTSSAITLADPLLARLRGEPRPGVVALGRHLATRSGHREPVKVGIALLGLGPEPADRDVLHTLARHEEFTLYCAVALANTATDREGELWRVAQLVDGWG